MLNSLFLFSALCHSYCNRLCCSYLLLGVLVIAARPALVTAVEVTAEKSDQGVVVKIDGSLFAEYLTCAGRQPVIWPIIGPTGEPVTRSFPQGPVLAEEKKDHPHHRSLWFTYGDVNGLDFWADHGYGHHKGTKNSIQHREFVSVESEGSSATLVTRNDWISTDQKSDKKICEDQRTIVFGSDGSQRWIDFSITLKATEGNVTFGDTKEGAFAVRVAGSMKVDAELGGYIVNSHGQTDAQTWGVPAEWVDYTGPVGSENGGETVGIAILSHPSNFRPVCRWHVRTYGLFAANPFGENHFTEGQPKSEPIQGAHTIAAGESLTLRYRVLFHRGDTKKANVAAAFRAFSQEQ